MAAYRLHFERANLEIAQLARGGKLGELRYFSSNFSQQIAPGNVRLDAEKGGGPVQDMGIYCINAARSLFGGGADRSARCCCEPTRRTLPRSAGDGDRP